MKTRIAKSFLTCLAAGSLFLAPALSLQAKTVKFPADDPAFSFNLPDGWTTETGKDGRLYCTAGDGSDFKIGFVTSPGVKSENDAKELLPKILKGMSDAMKGENYKTDEVKTGKMGDVSLIGMEGHCTVDGTEMALNALVFSLTPGHYFSIVGAASKEVDKAHDKDMNGIISSIAAVD
jgi:hypothetical protein